MGSRFFTTEALVIGSMRYREADCIITLYTRDRGRLSALAKGLRRPSSKVGGRLEPFSLVRVSLYPGRGLYTVVGTETVRTFQDIRSQLFRIEQGALLLSCVRQLFPQEEANPPVFNLLVRALAALAKTNDLGGASKVVLAARLKLLALLGYAPDLGSCSRCGAQEDSYVYLPSRGGVVCKSCWLVGEEAFPLSYQGLIAIRDLLARPLVEASTIPLDEKATAEAEQVLVATLAHHGH